MGAGKPSGHLFLEQKRNQRVAAENDDLVFGLKPGLEILRRPIIIRGKLAVILGIKSCQIGPVQIPEAIGERKLFHPGIKIREH